MPGKPAAFWHIQPLSFRGIAASALYCNETDYKHKPCYLDLFIGGFVSESSPLTCEPVLCREELWDKSLLCGLKSTHRLLSWLQVLGHSRHFWSHSVHCSPSPWNDNNTNNKMSHLAPSDVAAMLVGSGAYPLGPAHTQITSKHSLLA